MKVHGVEPSIVMRLSNGATRAVEQSLCFKVQEVTGHAEVLELVKTSVKAYTVVVVAPAS